MAAQTGGPKRGFMDVMIKDTKVVLLDVGN